MTKSLNEYMEKVIPVLSQCESDLKLLLSLAQDLGRGYGSFYPKEALAQLKTMRRILEFNETNGHR